MNFEGMSDDELLGLYKEAEKCVDKLDEEDPSVSTKEWITANNQLDEITDECMMRGIWI